MMMNGEAEQILPFFFALVALTPTRPAATTAADFVAFDALWRVDENRPRGGGAGGAGFKMFVAPKATLLGVERNKRRSDTSSQDGGSEVGAVIGFVFFFVLNHFLHSDVGCGVAMKSHRHHSSITR